MHDIHVEIMYNIISYCPVQTSFHFHHFDMYMACSSSLVPAFLLTGRGGEGGGRFGGGGGGIGREGGRVGGRGGGL